MSADNNEWGVKLHITYYLKLFLSVIMVIFVLEMDSFIAMAEQKIQPVEKGQAELTQSPIGIAQRPLSKLTYPKHRPTYGLPGAPTTSPGGPRSETKPR